MEILNERYVLEGINDEPFKTVPRGFLKSKESEIALDYPSVMLNLMPDDNVNIRLFLNKAPSLSKEILLMSGIVYKIEKDYFEASFGGLLLLFKGSLHEDLALDSKIYISVSKF